MVKLGLVNEPVLTQPQQNQLKRFTNIIQDLDPQLGSFVIKLGTVLALEVSSIMSEENNESKSLKSFKKEISRRVGLKIYNELAGVQVNEAKYLSKIKLKSAQGSENREPSPSFESSPSESDTEIIID